MGNVRKHRDINLVATERRRNIWCQIQTAIPQKFLRKIY